MIFAHTLDAVLDDSKTQTARVWKDNYQPIYDGASNLIEVRSRKTGNLIYYIGQEHAIQPGRGMHGVGRIRITHLARRDVTSFDIGDIALERLDNYASFIQLWNSMHNTTDALVIRFQQLEHE